MNEVSIDQWLAEMEQAARTAINSEGMTVREIAEATGHTLARVRGMLQLIQKQGRLKVGRSIREAINGVRRPESVYSVLPAKKGK